MREQVLFERFEGEHRNGHEDPRIREGPRCLLPGWLAAVSDCPRLRSATAPEKGSFAIIAALFWGMGLSDITGCRSILLARLNPHWVTFVFQPSYPAGDEPPTFGFGAR